MREKITTRMVNARLSEDLWQRVEEHAQTSGLKKTAIVDKALREWLDRNQSKRKAG